MKKLLAFVITLLALVVVPSVSALSVGERIIDFNSDILITRKSEAVITETIKYDFGSIEKHGIYRDIPIDYKDGNDKYYIIAKYLETTDENDATVQAETTEENGNLRIRLGDPNRTISGVHTYKIKYQLSPIITKKDGKQFLNLDLIGTGWDVPIEKASATIKLEDGQKLSNEQCFVGPQGSTTSCRDRELNRITPNSIQEGEPSPVSSNLYTATDLAAYEGMSVNAYLPDGYTKTFLEPNKQRPINLTAILVVAGAFFIPVLIWALIIGFAARYFIRIAKAKKREKERKSKQIVVAQYEAPDQLSPAEIGYLQDSSSDMREVTATVINWAVNGYIQIEQKDPKQKEYTFHKLKEGALPSYEKYLWDALFAVGSDVELKSLSNTTMSAAISKMHSTLNQELKTKGFYAKESDSFIETLTDNGAQEWAKVEGLKLYLDVAEKDRLNFSDAPEKTPEHFNKLLPYAIALGVEKAWVKQFDGMDMAQLTPWYSSSTPLNFSSFVLADQLNSTFSSVSYIPSASSSGSSFSSGGGSSGGGSGGGGGGSW